SGGKTKDLIKDSTTWGNHNNNLDRGKVTPNTPAKSGALDSWSTKNIYDLAGNVWEWTMESYSTTYPVIRSGCYNRSGSDYSASHRGYLPIGYTSTNVGFRAGLYIK
ncbi:MAG: SUMF1/EgtB/PvdO family nonheme iron enzyme, partial [Clostridia bacterium]